MWIPILELFILLIGFDVFRGGYIFKNLVPFEYNFFMRFNYYDLLIFPAFVLLYLTFGTILTVVEIFVILSWEVLSKLFWFLLISFCSLWAYSILMDPEEIYYWLGIPQTFSNLDDAFITLGYPVIQFQGRRQRGRHLENRTVQFSRISIPRLQQKDILSRYSYP